MVDDSNITHPLGQVIVRAGLASSNLVERALNARDQCHLIERLVATGAMAESDVAVELAQRTGRPRVSLTDASPERRALSLLSGEFCATHLVLPIEVASGSSGEYLVVAMADPIDSTAIRAIHDNAELRISPLIATASSIRGAIEHWYGVNRPIPESIVSQNASEDHADDATIAPRLFDDIFEAVTQTGSVAAPSVNSENEARRFVEEALQNESNPNMRILFSLLLSLAEREAVSLRDVLSRSQAMDSESSTRVT